MRVHFVTDQMSGLQMPGRQNDPRPKCPQFQQDGRLGQSGLNAIAFSFQSRSLKFTE